MPLVTFGLGRTRRKVPYCLGQRVVQENGKRNGAADRGGGRKIQSLAMGILLHLIHSWTEGDTWALSILLKLGARQGLAWL